MLISRRHRHAAGYSLVEALVVLIIMAVLLGLGIPSFQQTLASMRVRDSAESIQTGIRLAQGEAIRQNANVYFRLTYAPGGVLANCTVQNTWVDATNHVTNWVVTTTPLPSDLTSPSCNFPLPTPLGMTDDAGLLQVAKVDQGNRVGISTQQYQNDGTPVAPAPVQVCFNSMGTFCQNVLMPIKILVVDQVNSLNLSIAGRSLQVCAMPGGVKMCDPQLTVTNPSDPMACSADIHFC